MLQNGYSLLTARASRVTLKGIFHKQMLMLAYLTRSILFLSLLSLHSLISANKWTWETRNEKALVYFPLCGQEKRQNWPKSGKSR